MQGSSLPIMVLVDSYTGGCIQGLVKDQATTNASSLRLDFGRTNNLSAENAGIDSIAPIMSLRYTGNVGIGTTDPTSLLTLKMMVITNSP